MKRLLSIALFAIISATSFNSYAGFLGKPSESQIKKQKNDIENQSQKILKKLYKADPKAKDLILNSPGYATFSDFGMKIFIAGGGTGKGVVYAKGKDPVFMNMAEVQAGLGIGIKQFDVVFVFENTDALNAFVNQGWEFGGQATAAAKYEKNGGSYEGAVNVSNGIWMYQLTKNGLAAEITLKGTKYYKNSDLN